MGIRVKLRKAPDQRDHSPDPRGYRNTPLPDIGEGDTFREVIKKLSRCAIVRCARRAHPPPSISVTP